MCGRSLVALQSSSLRLAMSCRKYPSNMPKYRKVCPKYGQISLNFSQNFVPRRICRPFYSLHFVDRYAFPSRCSRPIFGEGWPAGPVVLARGTDNVPENENSPGSADRKSTNANGKSPHSKILESLRHRDHFRAPLCHQGPYWQRSRVRGVQVLLV